MLYQLKPFHCPFCNCCFSIRDYGRPHNASSFPLLLTCGHSVCEGCAKSYAHRHKKILCSDCQLPTDLSEGDASVSALLPDVYVLGVLNANMKRSLPSLKIKMLWSDEMETKDHQKQNYKSIVCEECMRREAVCSCEKCKENFCNICFDRFHGKGKKYLKTHEKKPIKRIIYNSMILKGCEEHSNKDLEFFCEDDSQLACSHCCITGKHKGHSVKTVHQKNLNCQDELKSAYEAALQVKRRMRYSEKKLLGIIPTLKVDSAPEITKVHNHFRDLHAALQVREHELIQQIEEISNAKRKPLTEMCQDLGKYQQHVDDLILDTDRVLKNPDVIINCPALIKKLEEVKSLPQHLVHIADEEPLDVHCHLDQVDILPLVKNIGRVTANTREMFELKSSSDLPEDYIFDTIPDAESVTTTTETESVRSDNFSEDSLSRALTPTTEKSDTPSFPDVTDNKHYSVSRSDRVIVSHIRDPSKFWVQRCCEIRRLKIMSDAINKWCRSAESLKHVPSSIIKGDLYLVQYSGDKKWYRARVRHILVDNEKEKSTQQDHTSDIIEEYVLTQISTMPNTAKNKNQKVEVIYVDYGNTEIVSVSRLKNIQTRFLNVPGMAKECSLYEIFPVTKDTWSTDAIKTFAKFVGNKETVMLISEERNGILYVDLCQAASSDITNDVPVSVRDALVFLELGQFLHELPVHVSPRRCVRQFLPSSKLVASSKCNVILSHIETPSLFYVQQVSTASSLSNLINDMNMTYKSDIINSLYSIYVPYVGMVCAAQYTVDKQWYRAEVQKLPGGAMVEVQYVDFGNKEVLHNRCLRKLFDRFIKLTKQAIECSLAEVMPVDEEGWSPEAKNWMMKVAYKKQLYLKSLGIIDDKASVLLFEVGEESTVCLNASLVKEKLATTSGPGLLDAHLAEDIPSGIPSCQEEAPLKSKSSGKDASPSNEGSRPCTPAASSPIPELPSLPRKNYKENSVPVIVSHIETPTHFYIQLGKNIQGDLKKMMKDLQLAYKTYEDVLDEVIVNGVYAVLSEKDDVWYRGTVLEVNDTVAKVFFLDYGFTQDVNIKNIHRLVDHMRVEEAFSLCCHLTDVQPAGDSKQWPQTSIEVFKDMVYSCDAVYFIRKDSEEGPLNSIASELYLEKLQRGGALEPSMLEYFSVTDLLIEKGVALRPRKKTESAIAKLPNGDDGSAQSSIPLRSSSSSASSDSSLLPRKHKIAQYMPKSYIKWKPFEIPEAKHFNAVVTYVDENGSIFLHDTRKGTYLPRQKYFNLIAREYPLVHKVTYCYFGCTIGVSELSLTAYNNILLKDLNKQPFTKDTRRYIRNNASGASKIDLIKNALLCKYAKTEYEKLHIPPPVGQACVAKFHLDKGWYRGEIISTQPNIVKVFFVDYGNIEKVSLDDVRLDIIMTDIPAQAIECKLAGLQPTTGTKKWAVDILDFMHLSIVEQQCTVDVLVSPKPGKPIQISLVLSSGIDMRDMLVQMGGAVVLDSNSAEDGDFPTDDSSSEVKTQKSEVSIFKAFMKPTPLREGEPFQVCVTQLVEPNLVFFQQLKIDDPVSEHDKMRNVEHDKFLVLMEELAEVAESLPAVEQPETGVPFCAKYSYDNSWYRCEVTDVCEEGVSVLYVDYGNSEVIPVNKLRQLSGHFVDFPVQSHFCKLHGVMPLEEDDWTPDAVAAMVDALFNCSSSMYARVMSPGDVCEVELLVKSEDAENKWELVYQRLAGEKFIRLMS